jgi:glycosyltransferase involved in cell wall biosynthesis
MKILTLVLNLTGQGTYWRAFHLARQLSLRGHNVTLLSTARTERLRMKSWQSGNLTLVESPDLFSGPLRSGWDPWNVLNRLAWLRRQPFDLVHAFEARPTVIYPALYAARRQHIPLVMDWCDWFGRGGSVEERPNAMIRAVLRPVETYYEEHFRLQAQGTTVICSLLGQKALHLGVAPESIHLLPNGSDIDHFGQIDLLGARRAINLPTEAFIIGYVGSIFQRDAQLMAEAFNLLETKIPDLHLLLAGKQPFDVSALVRSPKRLLTTGYIDVDRLATALSACDLFWLPLSDSNANRGRFPLKLNDYLASGRSIVATAVGDVVPVLADGEAGLLAEPLPAALADCTYQLYMDPPRRLRMGEQARQIAETRYHWAHIAVNLETVYKKVLDHAR